VAIVPCDRSAHFGDLTRLFSDAGELLTEPPCQPANDSLNPEKVAYWYFRLNDFFQIENFVVHPDRGRGQRTDADLLAVRFPHRAERLFDNPKDIMVDDEKRLSLSPDLIDVVIAEVKRNQPCTLNGPWTRQDQQNVHRVLTAIGCLPPDRINAAATDIYRTGGHVSDLRLRMRVVAVGRDFNQDIAKDYPDAIQLCWSDLLAFIWSRLRAYRQQKSDVQQWDIQGRKIKRLADDYDAKTFEAEALRLMGVQRGD
jgi:hypothetical protein